MPTGKSFNPIRSFSTASHDLTWQIFGEVRALLSEQKLLMNEGTIVDATITAAPSSTKNARKERDPEMHQTKKGNQW